MPKKKQKQHEPWHGVTIPPSFETSAKTKSMLRLKLVDFRRSEFYFYAHRTAKMLAFGAFVYPWREHHQPIEFPKTQALAIPALRGRESVGFNHGIDGRFYHDTGALVLQSFLDELDEALRSEVF